MSTRCAWAVPSLKQRQYVFQSWFKQYIAVGTQRHGMERQRRVHFHRILLIAEAIKINGKIARTSLCCIEAI